MRRKVLLLISNSYDTTSDLLVFPARLGRASHLTLTCGTIHRFEIVPGGFFLADPSGREIWSEESPKSYGANPGAGARTALAPIRKRNDTTTERCCTPSVNW